MPRPMRLILMVALFSSAVLVGILLRQSEVALGAPPPGFQNTVFIAQLNQPVCLTFASDGRMLIVERGGAVKVVQPGAAAVDSSPVMTIANINTSQGERGLVGITLDPNFASNGFFYVFYTANTPLRDRVSRFTLVGNVASPASEVVLWQDIVDASLWHHGGTVAFGPDGKLYISTGFNDDTASGLNNGSQRLDSYHGKILRINSDGSVPTDNPFFDGAGPHLDAIWAIGLRNPFRISFDSTTGAMYIGDVGGNLGDSIEELNVGVAGANYGWPICEGTCTTPGMTNPIFSYSHNNRDASIIGGLVYRGTMFPLDYRGSYLYADYAQNWIRRLSLDGNGNVTGSYYLEPADGTLDGPYGDIVDLKVGPDGALYYVDIALDNTGVSRGPGSVHKISYYSGNQPPVVNSVSANPPGGPGPTQSITFTASATDPENDPLTYTWTFGDSTSGTGATTTHLYSAIGMYSARVTVSDGHNQTISSPLTITIGSPPSATITSPSNGSTFRAGDVISFNGTATDDGPLSSSSYSWTILFHHDTHVHPSAGPIAGPSGTFQIPLTGHDFSGTTYFEFILTVTDSSGLTNSASTFIYPQKVNVTLNSSPTGLPLSLDQITSPAPSVHDTLVGFQHTIDAPLQQTANGVSYSFVSWSDGGAANHVITVPSTDQSYLAVYQAASPTTSPTAVPPVFPSTLVLDGFNRPNGGLGGGWLGTTASFSISGSTVKVNSTGDIYWGASAFGANQEAFVRLTSVDPLASEMDLILKSQSTSTWGNGLIEVWYDPVNHRVQIWTYASAQGWIQRGSDIPVTFVNGDQFGARAGADGALNVYRNGTLLATRDVSAWPFFATGGSVGLWFNGTTAAVFDDFGGGNAGPTLTVTQTPTQTNLVTSTATPTFTATVSPTSTNSPLLFSTGTPTPTAMSCVTCPPTPTSVASSFPSTGVVDTFDRPNGGVGANWHGSTGGYSLVGNQVKAVAGGDIYWQGGPFGPDQEAFVTLSTVDPGAAEFDLLLKSQSSSTWGAGLIEVWYDPINHRMQVWTFAAAQGWNQRGADVPVTFASGDQFGARSAPDGTVKLYRNRVLLATRDVTAWPYYASGGSIGLWFSGTTIAAFDDFGGGNGTNGPVATATPSVTSTVSPTRTPTDTNSATPTRTPTLTSTASSTQTPLSTPTPSTTAVSSPTPTATSTGPATLTPTTSTAVPTPTSTQTLTATSIPTSSMTPTSTMTFTSTTTRTVTRTPTLVLTATPTPTTGSSNLVGDILIEAGRDNNPSGIAEAFQYTASASGTASQISLYVDGSSSATTIVVGVYTNSTGNHPGTLLAQSTVSSPTKGAWNAVAVSPFGVVSGTTYWIAVLGPSGAGTVVFRDVASGVKCETSAQITLSSLPITWTSGATYFNAPMSAYVGS